MPWRLSPPTGLNCPASLSISTLAAIISYDALSAHLIGYLGEINASELQKEIYRYKESGDFIGRYGVEKSFDAHLSGVPGGRIVQMNAVGQLVNVLDTVAAEPGNNVYLTIDYALQSTAETLLKDEAGAIVAMDPQLRRYPCHGKQSEIFPE